MKALKLLRKQLKENYNNRPLFYNHEEWFKEKIWAFDEAIDELRDFIEEYQKLKENAEYMKNDTFNNDHDYIPYRTLRIKVSVASLLEEIKKLQQEIELIYQVIHQKHKGK